MIIHNDIREVYSGCSPYITMGTYDGVHRGHRSILERMAKDAHEAGTSAIVVTFNPHPRLVVDPRKAGQIKLLNTLEEKAEIMEDIGIDHFVIMPFNEELARIDYEVFVREYLFEPLHMQRYYIGHDHAFGKGRKGGYEALAALGEELGFAVHRTQARLDEGEAVSSSRIRKALASGDVKAASGMLGYDFPIHGHVIYGNRIGNTIGYPTANIALDSPDKLIPAMGVYAVEADVKGKTYGGMLNIGIRPTIDLSSVTIEVNIFDFDEDIYMEKIAVRFVDRIREEKKFGSLQELKDQLARDRETALALLG